MNTSLRLIALTPHPRPPIALVDHGRGGDLDRLLGFVVTVVAASRRAASRAAAVAATMCHRPLRELTTVNIAVQSADRLSSSAAWSVFKATGEDDATGATSS
ncbi:hypothetical protein NP284_10930 [Rhodopseudomonas pseudopalustris]|uniref:hypothetical protein n=1 Tax=Rhodopseudomonas pseudopalustris TaxID=1513892 RepID=UPI003F9D0FA4